MNKKSKIPNMSVWQKNRYARFNAKIDALHEHPKYTWLRNYADEAMIWNEGYGLLMIKGEDFIDRIETMDIAFIEDWLNGKNGLKREEYKVWLSSQKGVREITEQNIEQVVQQIDGLFRNYNRDARAFTVDYDEKTDGLYCYYTPYANDTGYVVLDDFLFVCETLKKDLQTLKDYLDENKIGSRPGCEWSVDWGCSEEEDV